MELQSINFSGQSNVAGGAVGVARVVNAFLDLVGPEGKTTAVLQMHDGLTRKAINQSALGTRGLWVIDDANLIWVAGVQCFHVDSNYNVTSLGGVPGTGPVTFAMNRKKPDPQIMIAGAGHRYLVEKLSGSWAINRIEDTALLATHSCGWVDGYFLAGYDDGRFGWSSLDEGSEWAALDRGTAESDPDKLVRLIVYNREVHLLGEKGLETFVNTGSSSVFERTATHPIGCKGRFSASVVQDGIIFVAADDTVRLGRGRTWRDVSTPEISRLLEDLDGETLRSWSYKKGGREFYALACDDWVKELNLRTGFWNDRESLIDGKISRWRAEHYAKWGSDDIFGSNADTRLYAASEDVFDEDGTTHTGTIDSPPQHAFPNGAQFHSIFVDVLPGVGLNSAEAHEKDPQLMISWSDDGGRSYSNEIRRPVGRIGEYSAQVRANRLGSTGPIGRSWRLQWSAPVSRKIMQASVTLTRLSV